ncbi:transglycosylase domain-containing protein [Cutibacterium avidum]|uniref:transglycosylase domain-containing protein n=1 Tax=Cutibacterium avidum TaxID=33010 RepID=UPI0008F55BFA|nr:transglycosylase domain-containing protein [Cutibacterium avidum]MCO6632032.1 transglycosylase domain-containing protein [Cutibacterium avidum]MCO6664341.1 transglycosylase domain-containing protein [Cutibacterium avidum]MCT1415521.1 transglycosylase domain-containing protein [Cutibacterium avidum]MCX8466243.1 transglycosylase domain-containing protein [Cutibacterium avidum]MCX8468446.1 transglycosylase domain-containing protein [Cutibacterium avidum]
MADHKPAKRPARRAAPAPGGARSAFPAARPRRGRHGKLKKFLWGMLVTILSLAIIAVIGVFVAYERTELPDPNHDFQTNTSFIYYRDGSRLGSFSVQNRQSIPYESMPKDLRNAVVSAENRTFWTDPGISVKGMVRAAWAIARGGEMQGGSTITQQYIKVLYLSQERTMSRKFKELLLAVKMGKEVSKQDILAGYLNTIYFGRGAYGAQAAAKAFFYTDASKLTLSQSAVLAAVLNSPANFDPNGGVAARERLLQRYRYVLDGMLEAGNITQAQHDEAYRQLPKFPKVPDYNRWAGTDGYLMKMVHDELIARGFSDQQIKGGGLKVTTTLDRNDQKAAVAAGQKYKRIAGRNAGSKGAENLHPALASVDVKTGGVLAIYGGDDYISNTRNWARTPRPSASTFKTYAAVAGMRHGFSLRSRLEGDAFTPDGDTTEVRNENNRNYSTVSMRRAIAKSINTAFVDMVSRMKDGPKDVVQAANAAGVPKGTGWDLNNRIALGTAEVSPLAQAGGYATIANDGKKATPHVVGKVVDQSGKVVYQAPKPSKQTIEADISHDVSYALQSVVEEGTGRIVADFDHHVAGKTGTSGVGDGVTAAWFVAYTKQISTAVMFVAGDSGNENLDPYAREGATGFHGGDYPARTWRDYMETAMKGMPDESFADPDWVNLSGKHYGEAKRPEVPVEEDSRDTSDNSDSNDPESPVEPSAPVPAASTTPSSKPSSTASQEPPKPSSTMTRTEPTHTRRPTHPARPTHTSHPTSGETTRGGSQPGDQAHSG